MSLLLSSSARTTPLTEARPQTKRKSLLSSLLGRGSSTRRSVYRQQRRSPSPRRRQYHRATVVVMTNPTLHWMQTECPQEVVPKILAYAGPQTVAMLSQTNRHWKNLCLAEGTWRILCEDLYKWKEGDEVPTSWREHYQKNPCVPIDYPSIPAALAISEAPLTSRNSTPEQRRSIRILLRPGDYILREAIVIQAVQDVEITIETMKGPFTAVNHEVAEEERHTELSSSPRWARKAVSIRNRLTCRSNNVDADMELEPPPMIPRLVNNSASDRASLILRTRRHNEPLVRVQRGTVKLINLELLHNSHGTDIWNGNAAVQIQPPPVQPRNSPTITTPRPTAWMESVEVMSHSGRGIVNIDGGFSVIQNCYVHDCAATGIYVGGSGTQAVIERTDILCNGTGSRRGIRPGHSGVYLEQGKATIYDCNISRNTLTGISAISLDNSVLDVQGSDLVGNGAAQLEMPRGSLGWHSVTRTNRLASSHFEGPLSSRSGLVVD